MTDYRTVRMGKSEGIVLIVFFLFARLFLVFPGEDINGGAGLVWLNYALGVIVSLGIGLMLVFIQDYFKGDLLTAIEILLGKRWVYFLGIFYATIFLTNGILLLRQFSENILQVGLREVELNSIIAIYAAMAGISIYFGIETLARTAYLLMPFIVAWMFFIYILLFPNYNIYNLAPWQGTGIWPVICQGFSNAGTNIGVLTAVILAPAFQNLRTKAASIVWGSAVAGFLKIISVIVFLLIIGIGAGREKISPFYEVTYMAYLDRYFQRLEAFTVLIWVFVGIISIGASMYIFLYLMARILKLPTIRPLIPVLSIIIYTLAGLPENIADVIEVDLTITKVYFGLGLYLFPVILGTAFLIRKKTILLNNSRGG